MKKAFLYTDSCSARQQEENDAQHDLFGRIGNFGNFHVIQGQKNNFLLEQNPFTKLSILDVIGHHNLQKFSKNLHPVPRYSSSKLVHFSCQNQFWRYNSVYGSRALLSMFGLNLGRP